MKSAKEKLSICHRCAKCDAYKTATLNLFTGACPLGLWDEGAQLPEKSAYPVIIVEPGESSTSHEKASARAGHVSSCCGRADLTADG